MTKIREDIIRSVIDHANIVDVVGDFLKLRKTGVRYTAICPFHEDRHDGNFIVYPKNNCFKCFACDKKGGSVEFVMEYNHMTFPDAIRYLGKKYCIEVDNAPFNYTPPSPRPTSPPLPVLELPREWVKRTMTFDYNSLPFTNWLISIPWDKAQRERLSEVLWLYCVGGWRDGRVVFWMIDNEGIPRAAKLMAYQSDGHRDKNRNPGWIYNQDGCRQICQPDNHEIVKPLFGIHLLRRYPKAAVHIVESEKTAVIMATAYGNHKNQVWMACGGVENLTRDKLAPIISEGRRIILYPDRDAIDKWRAKQANLRYDRLSINMQAVRDWWKPEDGEKADIADVVLRMIIERGGRPVTVNDIINRSPAFKTLVDKLELTQTNNG